MSGSSSIQERAPCSLREGKRTMKVVDVSFVADGINSNWPITGSTSKIRVHRIPSRIIENTCYESAYDHFHTQLIRDCNSSLIRREITLHRNHIDHIPWIHRIGIFACASVQLVYGPFCLVHAVDCVYLRKDKNMYKGYPWWPAGQEKSRWATFEQLDMDIRIVPWFS